MIKDSIANILGKEGTRVTRIAVCNFLCMYKATHTIQQTSGSGHPSKITAEVKALVEHQMMQDDETTASQLHQLLLGNRILISLKTILRCCAQLGWTFRGSAYCQLIRSVNKTKRFEWALNNLAEANNGFDDVVWTDESSIQLETHRRHSYRKIRNAPKYKPRYCTCAYTLMFHVKHVTIDQAGDGQ